MNFLQLEKYFSVNLDLNKCVLPDPDLPGCKTSGPRYGYIMGGVLHRRFPMLFIVLLVTIFLVCVFNVLEIYIKEKIIKWIKDTLRIAFVSSIVVIVFIMMFIFLPPV